MAKQDSLRAGLVGMAGGLTIGLLSVALAGLGFLLVGALIVGAAFNRPRLASVGGTMLGLGLGYLFLFGLAASRCAASACEGRDPTPWAWIDVMLLGVGVVASVAAWRTSRATARRAPARWSRGSRGWR
jgi:hypothetical protein